MRARQEMDQRGDTSEYARAILEKEEREAKVARARAKKHWKQRIKRPRRLKKLLDAKRRRRSPGNGKTGR